MHPPHAPPLFAEPFPMARMGTWGRIRTTEHPACLPRDSELATFNIPVPREKDRKLSSVLQGGGKQETQRWVRERDSLPWGRGTCWRTPPLAAPSWIFPVLLGPLPQPSLGPPGSHLQHVGTPRAFPAR